MFSQISNMRIIWFEFCLIILLLLLIFIVNISHIFYLILLKPNRSIRWILINSSLSSLIISIYLIPFYYFRTEYSSDSILWRLWSFMFHMIDAIQIYSLFLLLTIRSFQKFFIILIWFVPTIAYSPILWLPSQDIQLDYLPYRRLKSNVPWWILPILYFSMYFIPIMMSLVICIIHLIWPWMNGLYSRKIQQKNVICKHLDEHQKDMTELTDLIVTVMNFQLKQTKNQSKTCISSFDSKSRNSSLSYEVCQYKSFFLSDNLSISPLTHSSSIRTEDCTEKPLNSSILLIITFLLLFVHLPYIILSLLDLTAFQLSTFIYIHWFGSLFLPMIHIQENI